MYRTQRLITIFEIINLFWDCLLDSANFTIRLVDFFEIILPEAKIIYYGVVIIFDTALFVKTTLVQRVYSKIE